MNYILLDLEWNSAYSKRHSKFVNEIVQIGAVKLNECLEYIDDISIMVHSQLTKRLSTRFKQLTNITNDDMLAGLYLPKAVEKYNRWVGTDTVTLTWSTSDLYAIVENCNAFADGKMFAFEKYIDLQGYVQDFLHRKGHEFSGQISLKTAADILKLNTERFELHTARDDSMLSAEILRSTFEEKRIMSVTRNAGDPEFFKRMLFKPYCITSINDPAVDKECLRFKCKQCGTYAKRKTKWSYKNHWFSATFKCPRCNECFIGRISLKKHYDCIVTKKIIMPKKNGEKNGKVQPVPEKV